MYNYVCTCICEDVYINMRIYMHRYMYVYLYCMCGPRCAYTCVDSHRYAYGCACLFRYTYVYIDMKIHTNVYDSWHMAYVSGPLYLYFLHLHPSLFQICLPMPNNKQNKYLRAYKCLNVFTHANAYAHQIYIHMCIRHTQ